MVWAYGTVINYGDDPYSVRLYRSNPQEVFLRKSVLKIRNKFTGEHPCQIQLFTIFTTQKTGRNKLISATSTTCISTKKA